MKKANISSSSRRSTPWDDKEVLSESESFIKEKYLETYKFKHLKLSDTNEDKLINSFNPLECPYCKSVNFKRNGKTNNGIQRYKCNNCNKTFTVLTNTLFDNHKLPISEWIEFCLNILTIESTSSASRNNKNSYSTSRYWLNKLFIILKDYQDGILLKQEIQIDEKYCSVATKDLIYKDGKLLRGLSRNKYCIATGIDIFNNVYLKLETRGKPSIKTTLEAFDNHIDKGSMLKHDKEKSHKILIDKYDLIDEKYDSKEIKKLKDKDNPLSRINRVHYYIQLFLDEHSGYSRDNLQDYLNLISFILNPPYDKLLKVEYLMKKIINMKESLKYRDFYDKTGDF